VDQEGEVLEAFVTKRQDRKTSWKFLRKLLKRYGKPKPVVTDKLTSYGAVVKTAGNSDIHDTRQWYNNRSENSHQPFRRRERAMQKFKSFETLQKFVSVHSSVHNHFNHQRHLERRCRFKSMRSEALAEWFQLAA
jgi:putative transposase